jgi:hypothetical protein
VDTDQASVHLIDLAKTETVPDGKQISHRDEWAMGNHEDGMLFGLDHLIDCWIASLDWLEGKGRRKTETDVDFQNSLGEMDMRELKSKLETHSIDTKLWGVGSAKSMMELYCEINEEEAVTFEVAEDGRFFRVINVIKAWILVELSNDDVCVLVEPKKRRKFSQDATWKMQAVKGKPLQKKVSQDSKWEDTVKMAIAERLGIPAESQDEVFEWKMNTYNMSTDIRRGTPEDGYVGLWSKYRIHEIDIAVRNKQDKRLAPLGLPDGADFMTVQTAGLHSAFGHRQHAWKWQKIQDAGYKARDNTQGDGCEVEVGAKCVQLLSSQNRKSVERSVSAGDYLGSPLPSEANLEALVERRSKTAPTESGDGTASQKLNAETVSKILSGDQNRGSGQDTSCCCGIAKFLS